MRAVDQLGRAPLLHVLFMLVLVPDKLVQVGVALLDVEASSFSMPVQVVRVGPLVATGSDVDHLVTGPGVEVDGFHFADVDAEGAVAAGAFEADEDAEGPGGPAGHALGAVGADLVVLVVWEGKARLGDF